MPPDADDDLASDRALADAIIRDAFRRAPDRVVAGARLHGALCDRQHSQPAGCAGLAKIVIQGPRFRLAKGASFTRRR